MKHLTILSLLLPALAFPAALPPGYVATPVGVLPATCVTSVPSGSTVQPGGPCAQAQTSAALTIHDASTHTVIHPTGWLAATIAYNFSAPFPGKLSARWVVPPPGTANPDATAFLFPGLASVVSSASQPSVKPMILQPVLQQQNGISGAASWRCDDGTNCVHSEYIWAYPGDLLQGIVESSGCSASSGLCQTWTITTINVTRGTSTVLYTGVAGQKMTVMYGLALEAYGIDWCSQLPRSGSTTATDIEVWSLPTIFPTLPGGQIIGPPHGERIYPAWTSYTPITNSFCTFSAVAGRVPSNGNRDITVLTWSTSP